MVKSSPVQKVRRDRVILLTLFALFLFVSPFQSWWAADDSPWYLPYLIWLLLIVLTARPWRIWGNDEL